MLWFLFKSNCSESNRAGVRALDPGATVRRTRALRRVDAFVRIAALAVMLAPLGACSTFNDLFGKKDDEYIDEPADKLYNEGLYLLNDKGSPKEAAKKFEEVDRQHPYSDWARKSLIMSAYAYYEGGEYEDSITAAKRYVTLHPGSPDA